MNIYVYMYRLKQPMSDFLKNGGGSLDIAGKNKAEARLHNMRSHQVWTLGHCVIPADTRHLANVALLLA